MKKSKHPVTVCWLLEILHILTNKFTAPQSLGIEGRLVKKMDSNFEFLLTQAAKIIKSDTNLLEKTRDCNLTDIHLSPSIYELLKRFEFI